MFSYAVGASAQASSQFTFTENLSLGSSGTQVTALQKLLNRDPDTRVASTGTGSPGYETSYFGSMTRNAVVRFQEKYVNEVLMPVGLVRGNGRVGFYTRAKLNALSALTASKVSESPPATPPVTDVSTPTSVITPPTLTAPATAPTNPNLKNLDKFLVAIEEVAKKQGSSVADISIIKKEIAKIAATTTNLQATFEEMVRKQSNQSVKDDSLLNRTLVIIEQAIEGIFLPKHALAAVGVPFGGELLAATPCFCSATWLIYISPLPPTFSAILTYVPGSQAFLSYNIPFTSWLLGDYIPGAGACLIPGTPCWYIPSEGMITPIVGSSLL